MRDFEQQQVKLLPYEEAEGLLPNATNDYMNGLVRGFAGNDAELDDICFHATERLGSHHHLLHTKMVSDAVQSQRWEDVGSSVTVPLPTNIRDFVATQAIVAEYYKRTNDFRQHLENFIVTRLTKELRLLKEDTEDFVEVAKRLDQIREKKKKKVERRAFVLERAKQRSIENGTYTPATESIITRALARKGVVEEEDILDQALEYLRREGKRFTHKDIPSIRKDNFDQKFRAIYFNGSLKPHDKARMVALTISNFIVSTEELQVAAGALEVMSAEPTTFEKQEKQMEQSQGKRSKWNRARVVLRSISIPLLLPSTSKRSRPTVLSASVRVKFLGKVTTLPTLRSLMWKTPPFLLNSMILVNSSLTTASMPTGPRWSTAPWTPLLLPILVSLPKLLRKEKRWKRRWMSSTFSV